MQRILSGNGFFKANGVGSLDIAGTFVDPFWGYEFDVALGGEWVTTGWSHSVSGGILTASRSGQGIMYAPLDEPLQDGQAVEARLQQASSYVGICARGANGKSLVGALQGSPSYVQRVTSAGSYEANYVSAFTSTNTTVMHHQRVLVSGSNLLFQDSPNGETWTTRATVPASDFGGSIVAAGFHNYGGTLTADWIRKTQP